MGRVQCWYGLADPGADLRKGRRLDPVDEALAATGVEPRSVPHRADLFDRPLRAEVPRPDQEDDAVNKLKRMAEHEPLHFSVVDAAPVGAGQERPADLDLALGFVVTVEPRGADDAAVRAVDGDQ